VEPRSPLEPAESPPPLAWVPLGLVALLIVGVHAICLTQYGWFRDELYYASCARRLAWGYVDHPPFSIAVLAFVRHVFGDGLAVLRVVAALASASVSVLAAALARELGGRRYAQVLAALALGLAPLSLAVGHFYSLNVFDLAFWSLASLLSLRAFERDARPTWAALGLAIGLGLLNKWSVAWLCCGLVVALLVSPQRRRLLRVGPWLAAALAAAILAPNLIWEVLHGWPTLEFMHNARTQKMAALDPFGYLLNLVLAMGPGAAPLWLGGLVAALVRPRWRTLAIVFVVALAIQFASGSARVEYLALATPALFAAGATWWEGRGRLARGAIAALAVLLAIPIAPLTLPVLPVNTFLAYQAALGRTPHSEERHRMGRLSQQYADMFGWPELADSVARVAATLTPAERAGAIVIADNYGQAGALEELGAGRIPRIACQHNSWYEWGPPAWDGSVAILLRRDSAGARREFDDVRVGAIAGHPLAMPYEQDLPILVARGFHADLAAAWKQGKHYQ
jgi:hypothetical protein